MWRSWRSFTAPAAPRPLTRKCGLTVPRDGVDFGKRRCEFRGDFTGRPAHDEREKPRGRRVFGAIGKEPRFDPSRGEARRLPGGRLARDAASVARYRELAAPRVRALLRRRNVRRRLVRDRRRRTLPGEDLARARGSQASEAREGPEGGARRTGAGVGGVAF